MIMRWNLVIAATCLAIAGCGPGYQLDTGAVTGQVTIDDQPVTKGFVVFVPPTGRRASGPIDSEGRFSLTTYRNNDGAIVGLHSVGVVAYEDMDQYYKAFFDDTGDYELPKEIVPAEYGDPFSSGLTFEVKPGRNQADFHLKSNN